MAECFSLCPLHYSSFLTPLLHSLLLYSIPYSSFLTLPLFPFSLTFLSYCVYFHPTTTSTAHPPPPHSPLLHTHHHLTHLYCTPHSPLLHTHHHLTHLYCTPHSPLLHTHHHSQAADARRALPCWDEPAHKATFDVTLIVPKDRVALSNMVTAKLIRICNGRLPGCLDCCSFSRMRDALRHTIM